MFGCCRKRSDIVFWLVRFWCFFPAAFRPFGGTSAIKQKGNTVEKEEEEKKIWKHEEKTPKQLLTICLPWSSSSLDLRTSTWREASSFYFSSSSLLAARSYCLNSVGSLGPPPFLFQEPRALKQKLNTERKKEREKKRPFRGGHI